MQSLNPDLRRHPLFDDMTNHTQVSLRQSAQSWGRCTQRTINWFISWTEDDYCENCSQSSRRAKCRSIPRSHYTHCAKNWFVYEKFGLKFPQIDSSQCDHFTRSQTTSSIWRHLEPHTSIREAVCSILRPLHPAQIDLSPEQKMVAVKIVHKVVERPNPTQSRGPTALIALKTDLSTKWRLVLPFRSSVPFGLFLTEEDDVTFSHFLLFRQKDSSIEQLILTNNARISFDRSATVYQMSGVHLPWPINLYFAKNSAIFTGDIEYYSTLISQARRIFWYVMSKNSY